MRQYESLKGYIAKWVGGFTVALGVFSQIAVNDKPILEYIPGISHPPVGASDLIAGAVLGAATYYIGDRIHNRELQEARVSALEELVEVSIGADKLEKEKVRTLLADPVA